MATIDQQFSKLTETELEECTGGVFPFILIPLGLFGFKQLPKKVIADNTPDKERLYDTTIQTLDNQFTTLTE